MTVRQHSFYLEDEDWKALRHYCLDHGMSVSAFVARAAREAIGAPVREIHDVQLMEVSVAEDTEGNRRAGAGYVIPSAKKKVRAAT